MKRDGTGKGKSGEIIENNQNPLEFHYVNPYNSALICLFALTK